MRFDSDEKKIRAIIDAIPRPDFLTEVRFRFDDDWSGAPSVKAIGLLKERKDVREYWEPIQPFDDAFQTAIRQSGLDYQPYIIYRTESEQREIDGEKEREQEKAARRHRKAVAAA